ncbi:MAG TPA: hypothetical protein VHU15_06750 [Stellaceae bacterium]|jgi:uncharacterized sodium:solute symporter family permease YidK|nr:hypothetical protein [Stellaceae bacterium]
MTTNDLIGCIAATLVLATFCTKRMVQLRAIAMVSNIAFVAYGYRAGLFPILFLHMTMLPMNALRLRQELTDSSRAMLSRVAWRPWA